MRIQETGRCPLRIPPERWPASAVPISRGFQMIYLWVRATVDWADEDAFYRQLPDYFVDKVRLWNDTFTIPYHLYRHRVREIALLNWSRMEQVQLAHWDEVPEGGIVVPADDDDWFQPDLAGLIEAAREPDKVGYHWTESYLEIPTSLRHEIGRVRRLVFPRTAPKLVCSTNNYAIVKANDHRLPRKAFALNHKKADEFFRPRQEQAVKRIQATASVMNRTLASKTTLGFKGKPISKPMLLLKYHRYHRLYAHPVPAIPQWSHEYLGKMAELTQALKLRPGSWARRS